jgi:hypothetical protein
MMAKPLNTVVGQPTTKSMDRMMEQMVQMVAPVKTTAWGRLHGSLALVLDNADYATLTRQAVKSTDHLVQPPVVNPAINDDTPQRKLLRLQAETKDLLNLQEVITNIGVQHIINSVEEQNIEELNEYYIGYDNQTFKSLLAHLCTNWCKVMTKECTDATKGFYHSWVPSSTNVITFGCQLTKLKKGCCTINVIISDKAKMLHFVGQMYKSDYFMDEQMTKYEKQSDTDKLWDPTLDHFSKLFAQRKAYGNDRAANSKLESDATMYDIPSNRIITTTKSSGEFTSGDLYIESLKESLALACNYVTNSPTTAPAPTPVIDPMATLRLDMEAGRKQFELLLKQNLDLVTAFAKASASTNPGTGTTPKPRRTGCKRSWAHLKECPNCKKICTHKPADCFSLAANADKCPTNWKVLSST